MVTTDQVWAALDQIPDPEIPVISLVELGVVRDVAVEGNRVHVSLTPTFLGCPALEAMQRALESKITELGGDRYLISSTGTPFSGIAAVEQSFHQHAKEVATAHGFDAYKVVDLKSGFEPTPAGLRPVIRGTIQLYQGPQNTASGGKGKGAPNARGRSAANPGDAAVARGAGSFHSLRVRRTADP